MKKGVDHVSFPSEYEVCVFPWVVVQIAREHGIRFLETSAKASVNIEKAFLDLAEAILNKTMNQEQSQPQDRVHITPQSRASTNKCC